MKSYYIDANEKIQVIHAANGRVKRDGRHFTSEQEWSRIAGDLPMVRLVGIWNALPGVTPVARFTSRAKAVKRIWKTIARIEPNGGIATSEPDAAVTLQSEQRVNKGPARGRGSRRHFREDPEPRNSKKAQIVALLKRDQGASIDQLVLITGWQKHSVRGFLSGTMRKKMGLKIVSFKNDQGARTYRIAG
jgi:hypothetical protein